MKKEHWILFTTTLVTVLLYSLPWSHYIVYPVMLLCTYAHEVAHGLAAMIFGARFTSLQIWLDGSGAADWEGAVTPLGEGMIALGGLIGPSLLAGVLFGVACRPKSARWGLIFLALAMFVSCLLVVRNPFGWLVVGLWAAVMAAVGGWSRPTSAQLFTVFVAIQLTLSAFSRSDYLFTTTARTRAGVMPSDVAQIANVWVLPFWFWGALCALVSLLILGGGVKLYLYQLSRAPSMGGFGGAAARANFLDNSSYQA